MQEKEAHVLLSIHVHIHIKYNRGVGSSTLVSFVLSYSICELIFPSICSQNLANRYHMGSHIDKILGNEVLKRAKNVI